MLSLVSRRVLVIGGVTALTISQHHHFSFSSSSFFSNKNKNNNSITGFLSLFAPIHAETSSTTTTTKPGEWDLTDNSPAARPDLPTYSLEEVHRHYDIDTRCWVTYRGAVYDVTEFVKGHPGGMGRLLMAGGRDLEPFWKVYALHYRGHIVGLLERYRIGNLSREDAEKAKQFEFDSIYEEDPPRHQDLAPATHKPFCGELRTDQMTHSYYTPNELFYVRNHMRVPDVDPEEWELVVDGYGIDKPYRFTLNDLKEKFPMYEVVSTLQCAGNRMEDAHGIANGPSRAAFMSPHWAVGAISNAKWGGARIRDILEYCGVDVDALALGKIHDENYHHVEFAAIDTDETGGNYHASCPFDKVVDPFGDCLIAYEMNERALPRDHGFPARVLVPGHAGARQPKWIERITIKPQAWGVFQCTAFAPDVTFENDLAHWPPTDKKVLENNGLSRSFGGTTTTNSPDSPRQDNVVREMPVQSIVSYPPQNSTIALGKNKKTVMVKGVAWSGGGLGIKRVDVSVDCGKTFTAAELYKPVIQHPRGQWGWTQFSKEVPLAADIAKQLEQGHDVELCVTSKALDGNWNVQPENAKPYVNPRGVATNHWYKVKTTLTPASPRLSSLFSSSSSSETVQRNPQQEASDRQEFANVPSGGRFRLPFQEAGWKNQPGGEQQTWKDWHTVSNAQNTKQEPGIEATIDWKHYQNIKAPAYFENPVRPAKQK